MSDETGLFCPGCNAVFHSTGAEAVCSRCGMWLVHDQGLDASQPTFTSTAEPSDPSSASDTDCLRRLIGGQLDEYRIDALLGRGGMGWVFLAHHEQLQRPVALKILAPQLTRRDPAYLLRFREEGRAAAGLNHPNIITTHAIGESTGLHFLEMEFVPGRSLQAEINKSALPSLRALTIAAGIATGLSTAHRAGIIHRDLKPDNILLTHFGQPKITDFGLAKRIASREVPAERTLAGTPHYMAPELFQGEQPTPASDVYALGVTLFCMLTGTVPFARPKLSELIHSTLNDPLPELRERLPRLPLELAECVTQMLSRSPANRPADGTAAAQYLLAILGQARDLEETLHRALDTVPTARWRREYERYTIDVELPAGRSQRVFVEIDDDEPIDRIVSIYSVCGKADPSLFAEALALNSRLCHGAMAVREVAGHPQLIVINNHTLSTIDPAELRGSVLEAARFADLFESRMSSQDHY